MKLKLTVILSDRAHISQIKEFVDSFSDLINEDKYHTMWETWTEENSKFHNCMCPSCSGFEEEEEEVNDEKTEVLKEPRDGIIAAQDIPKEELIKKVGMYHDENMKLLKDRSDLQVTVVALQQEIEFLKNTINKLSSPAVVQPPTAVNPN